MMMTMAQEYPGDTMAAMAHFSSLQVLTRAIGDKELRDGSQVVTHVTVRIKHQNSHLFDISELPNNVERCGDNAFVNLVLLFPVHDKNPWVWIWRSQRVQLCATIIAMVCHGLL